MTILFLSKSLLFDLTSFGVAQGLAKAFFGILVSRFFENVQVHTTIDN
jgi:hypothetical protein